MVWGKRKPALVLVVLLLMVTSLPASVVGVDSEAAMAPTTSDSEPADAVYVTEDGDAIAVYHADSPKNTTGEYGMDVAENLMYMYMEDANASTGGVNGTLAMDLDPESFTADGQMQAPVSSHIHALNLSVSGEHSADEATADADLSMVVNGTTDSMNNSASAVTTEGGGLATHGWLSMTTDSVESAGTATVDDAQVKNDTYLSVEATGTETGARFHVIQRQTLNESEVGLWNTTANANRTLHSLFANGTAEDLGGRANITLDDVDHEFYRSNNSLDIAYTVEYVNVRDGLGEMLAGELATQDQLNESQANQLANATTDVTIETVAATVDADADSNIVTASWAVDVRNLQPVAETTFNITAAANDNISEEIRNARNRFEAADAAGYSQNISWDVSIVERSTTTAIDGAVGYETANRAAYTDELDARGIEYDEYSYELTAEIPEADNQLFVDATVTIQGREMLNRALDSTISTIRDDPDADNDAASLLKAVDAADVEHAKMDVSIQKRTVSVETGAQFDNITAFRSAMADEFGGESATHLYGEVDERSEDTHVYLTDAVEKNASEDDVESLAIVGENTTINMPSDDWNESDLPRLNTTKGKAYIGVQDDNTETDTGDGDFIGGDGSGFGAAIGLITLLTALLMARTRSRD